MYALGQSTDQGSQERIGCKRLMILLEYLQSDLYYFVFMWSKCLMSIHLLTFRGSTGTQAFSALLVNKISIDPNRFQMKRHMKG